jgi:uncharacterized protein (DUF2062 family)
MAEGTSPQKLSMTIAMGIILGLFPLIGATSLLCLGASFALGLNKVFIQMVNYLVYPVQLVLFIPLIKTGNQVFNFTGSTVDYQNLLYIFKTDTLAAMGEFGYLLLSAILLWLIAALPLSILLYRSSLKYIKRLGIKT